MGENRGDLKQTAKPKQKQPCPCGSGKLYKNCCFLKERKRRARLVKQARWLITRIAVVVVLVLLVYGISQIGPSIAFTDRDLGMINFSGLNTDKKEEVLVAANRAACTCGCGMNLAQCVATDSTCPIRSSNIQRIVNMIGEAKQ